jgi:hypothetical protein
MYVVYASNHVRTDLAFVGYIAGLRDVYLSCR